jgi:endonuclease IV
MIVHPGSVLSNIDDKVNKVHNVLNQPIIFTEEIKLLSPSSAPEPNNKNSTFLVEKEPLQWMIK